MICTGLGSARFRSQPGGDAGPAPATGLQRACNVAGALQVRQPGRAMPRHRELMPWHCRVLRAARCRRTAPAPHQRGNLRGNRHRSARAFGRNQLIRNGFNLSGLRGKAHPPRLRPWRCMASRGVAWRCMPSAPARTGQGRRPSPARPLGRRCAARCRVGGLSPPYCPPMAPLWPPYCQAMRSSRGPCLSPALKTNATERNRTRANAIERAQQARGNALLTLS